MTFKGTSTAASGSDFLMHFVYNPRKPPGRVYMNATELGMYEEHLRAKLFRNNSFDQEFSHSHSRLALTLTLTGPTRSKRSASDPGGNRMRSV